MSGGKLPEGWVDTQLGNIVDYGKATKSVLSDVNDDTWVLELEDIEKESSKLLSTIRASERPFKSTKNSFKRGDVLYGKLRPYLNKIIIAKEDGVCTTEIIPLSAEPSCCNKYIFYWLRSSTFQRYVNDVSYGVNMPRLGTADGLKAPLRLAPLAEQKIIAEKLDTLLAQIDSTKAHLDKIPQILKRFRQSVLNTAVRGDLTKSWRENTQLINMVELLEKFISLKSGKLRVRKNAITENYKKFISLPDSWGWSENHNLAKDNSNSICAGPFGTIFKAKDFRSEGIPIIFLRHVKEGVFNQNKPTFMDREIWGELHQDYSVFGGELLVTKLGDPPGESCIYPQKFGTAMVTPDVLKMDVDNEIADTKYLMHYFNSPLAKKIITELAFGATRLRIDIAMFKNFPVPLPSLEEQHEIVRRVEQLFAYADTIEKQVNNALNRVNSLTQSILAKAFRGELTVQWRAENPELISGENSAAALLEKIKAERAASGGKKTARKKA
ncbi:restriction endonuclease subunit S [Citrobacter koseri]|uniref:restriction endonuclease subunit S n=1 Tax=Citrobacter koseri TaxID=545 RepID=UPI00388F8C74|nr:restriction endonuclease subunit S [Citrobacter koseri]